MRNVAKTSSKYFWEDKRYFSVKEDFLKSYNEESDGWYFLEVHVQCPNKLNELHNNLPFLPERIKIEKVEKFIVNLNDKSEYVIHIRNVKQGLNHGLVFTKFIEWLNLIKMLE